MITNAHIYKQDASGGSGSETCLRCSSLDAFRLRINQSALETVPRGLISALLQIEVGVGSGQRYKGALAYSTGH